MNPANPGFAGFAISRIQRIPDSLDSHIGFARESMIRIFLDSLDSQVRTHRFVDPSDLRIMDSQRFLIRSESRIRWIRWIRLDSPGFAVRKFPPFGFALDSRIQRIQDSLNSQIYKEKKRKKKRIKERNERMLKSVTSLPGVQASPPACMLM